MDTSGGPKRLIGRPQLRGGERFYDGLFVAKLKKPTFFSFLTPLSVAFFLVLVINHYFFLLLVSQNLFGSFRVVHNFCFRQGWLCWLIKRNHNSDGFVPRIKPPKSKTGAVGLSLFFLGGFSSCLFFHSLFPRSVSLWGKTVFPR